MTVPIPRSGHATWWAGPVLAILVACAGCTGASSDGPLPTLPTGLQTGLQPGAYVLEVTGADAIDTDGQSPGCRPSGQPAAGRRVAVTGLIQRDGEDWLFRTDRPGTDLVMRLRVATRSFSTELFAIDGTLRGSAPDQGSGTRAASGVRVTGGGDAAEVVTVDGEIRLTGAIINALANGPVAFADGLVTATCTRVTLAMQPAAGPR